MAIELYKDAHHICLMFNDLVKDAGDNAVQANQFLIVSDGQGALLDPSGNITYNSLVLAMQRYLPKKNLKYLFASHQDPDIIGALDKWLFSTECQLYVSQLWSRFVPHFCNLNRSDGRIVGIPDEGMPVPMGVTTIHAVPAHFLHAEGNFQFYDSRSKILFSGDMGASMVDAHDVSQPITTKEEFLDQLPAMRGFHQRYMVSNKVCRLWANMVRSMDLAMMVPQHGRYFVGREAIHAFLDWIENLQCGIDLFTQEHYRFHGQKLAV
ncbi:MBL fold metallo-hydrolase [Undibacterium sp. Rencai35W]|uniref:MBL fold metallo-hydrolase n=1 Tax=Undibacterium sp. Rencai35W TaxID=3413046 RepID=UPI003BF2583F